MLAVPAVLAVAFVANAWWLVFGAAATPTASPLVGEVLLAGVLGGAAVVFTRGILLVLTPLTAVVADSVRAAPAEVSEALRLRAARGVGFMTGFAAAFWVVISGTPDIVAGLVSQHQRITDVVGGAALLVYGLIVAARPGSSLRDAVRRRGRRAGPGAAGVLGLATGLVLTHDLDPLYDSVFFLTGNPVAASHAPLTVAVFTLGLSLAVLTGTMGAIALVSHLVVGDRILAGLRIGGGFLTALLGSVVLLDRFSAIRALLLS